MVVRFHPWAPMSCIKKIDCKDELPKWHVWVEIQDGTEYCGSFPSKEEAISEWMDSERILNYRKDDELSTMLPYVLGESKYGHSPAPKKNKVKTKKQNKMIDQWDMI